MKFSKTLNVEAIQWFGVNEKELKEFCPEIRFYTSPAGNIAAIDKRDCTMRALKGDWIVKNESGEFVVIERDLFASTYQEVK